MAVGKRVVDVDCGLGVVCGGVVVLRASGSRGGEGEEEGE